MVQDYTGALDSDQDKQANGLKRGFKLEKNSVIKLGRVRLRVRDIDYADDKPFKPPNLVPQDVKEKAHTKERKEAKEEPNSESVVDINEIQLIEEAQAQA